MGPCGHSQNILGRKESYHKLLNYLTDNWEANTPPQCMAKGPGAAQTQDQQTPTEARSRPSIRLQRGEEPFDDPLRALLKRRRCDLECVRRHRHFAQMNRLAPASFSR